MSYVRRSLLAVLCVGLMAAPAAFAAPAPDMTPPKLALDAFLAQSRLLHDTTPKMQPNLQPQASADAGKPLSPAASNAIADLLSKAGAPLPAESTGLNLAIGQGRLPVIPAMNDLDHATARAMVAAFTRPAGVTAEDQAQIAAAAASTDPVMDEKVTLVRTLYRVDGTDALLRRFVATQHMRLIITEVNNHIQIGQLSEADRYRLSAIAAQAETDLEDKILTMDARAQAGALSKPELLTLIAAFDSDAQRKMTKMRLTDAGKLDRAIDLDVTMAQLQVVKKYEGGE